MEKLRLTDLKQIDHKTMADVVEARLRQYLREKSFKPGDQLPTEKQLADALIVSRNVAPCFYVTKAKEALCVFLHN